MAIPVQIHFRLYAGAHDAYRLGKFRFRHKIWQVPPFSLLRAGKIIAKAEVIQNAGS
jgi:hypothetical protein